MAVDDVAQTQISLPMPMQVGEAVTPYAFRLMAK
jgi:hypothetical protein